MNCSIGMESSWRDFDEDLVILDDVLVDSKETAIYRHPEPKQDSESECDSEPKPVVDVSASPAFGFGFQENETSPELAADMIAQEMAKMSLQEKQEALDEMKGAAQEIQERREFVEFHLDIMEACLDQMVKTKNVDEHTKAYRLALVLNPEYVRGRSFLLMFLRASDYDARAAADHLMLHLTEKLNIFGVDMLTKDLDMNDMTEDDREAMESDCISVLPVRANNGRIIIRVRPENVKSSITGLSMKRSYWFTIMSALQDPLTQFHGAVCVATYSGADSYKYVDMLKTFQGSEQFMPVKCRGAFYFAENPVCKETVPLVQYYMSRACRTHFHAQIGTMDRNIGELYHSFGILLAPFKLAESTEARMVEQSNRWRLLSQHKQRLAIRQANSDVSRKMTIAKTAGIAEQSSSAITVLNDNDVLWGRGKSRDYIGNRRAQQIVNELRPKYKSCDQYGKTAVIMEAIQLIKERGGRFLRNVKDVPNGIGSGARESCEWIEQSDEASREKLGKFFRK